MHAPRNGDDDEETSSTPTSAPAAETIDKFAGWKVRPISESIISNLVPKMPMPISEDIVSDKMLAGEYTVSAVDSVTEL